MHVIQCLEPVDAADTIVRLLLGHPQAAEAGG